MNIQNNIAGFSKTDPNTDQFELHLVRESQAVKVHQSHYVLPLVIIVGIVYIVSLWDDAPRFQLVLWEVLILLAACFRAYICNQIERKLDKADVQELYANELWLFYTSLASTLIIGSGFWWICIDGTDRTVFAVTLLCCMYAIGTTINSSVRFNNFPILLLANLGQGILFLSGLGRSPDLEVSAALISITLILIQFGKRNSHVFTESIRIRDEIRQQNIKLESDKKIIEQALTSAKVANEDKSRFLAAASHDLRQPLHAMTLFLASLKGTAPPPKSIEIIEKIEETTNVLSDQFNSLLDLSKFDAGVVETNFSEFQLDKLLHSIVDSVRADAIQKNLDLTLETNSVRVTTDRLLIERLIRNIVLNAIRYTEQGSISVQTVAASNGLHLIVHDTGPGIEKADQEKIFEDFYQPNNPARSQGKGSGLGLAIVKRISALLDLTIKLESEPGQGTSFDVFIPTPDAGTNRSTETSEEDQAPEEIYEFANLNILLIDDNPDILDALSRLVETWNCVPFLASTTQAAREVIDGDDKIDFAIVDDMLGQDESGLELADFLSSKIDNRPIIITGNVLPNRMREIQKHGFEVYQKPVDVKQLRKAIATRSADYL